MYSKRVFHIIISYLLPRSRLLLLIHLPHNTRVREGKRSLNIERPIIICNEHNRLEDEAAAAVGSAALAES